MAAGILRKLLAEKLNVSPDELTDKGFHVASAGVSAFDGAAASGSAITVMETRGIDITGHRSKLLTVEQINRADYIYAMTPSHLDSILMLAPDAADRVRLLSDEPIEDPVGAGEDVYRRCADHIESALRQRLEEVPL
jgi:protein-tyrosine phosphatase